MTWEVFEEYYTKPERPPWDQDEPGRFVVEADEAGRIRGDVLDVGCGTGENALYLAERGYRVVGVDGAATGLAAARAKAARRGVKGVEFVQADARELAGYTDRFDTVIDSGLFHVFGDPADQARYAIALHRACRSGATIFLVGFSAAGDYPAHEAQRPAGCGTHGISENELRAAFEPLWSLDSLAKQRLPRFDGEVYGLQATLSRRNAA